MEAATKVVANNYLSFELNNEYFAIELNKIRSILEMCNVAKIPNSPDFILGSIQLRNSKLPVIDVRKRLKLAIERIRASSSILVLDYLSNHGQLNYCIIVDKVIEVIEITDKDLLETPQIGEINKKNYFRGVYYEDQVITKIINLETLFPKRIIKAFSKSF